MLDILLDYYNWIAILCFDVVYNPQISQAKIVCVSELFYLCAKK